MFGNAFAELRCNSLSQPLRLETSSAKYTRRGVEEGVYWFLNELKEAHQFEAGQVFHLIEPDINHLGRSSLCPTN